MSAKNKILHLWTEVDSSWISFCFGHPGYYRPQTKFAKVMFLHVTVILSTGGSPGPYTGGRLRGLTGGGSPGPYPGGEVGGSGQGGLQAQAQGVYPSMHWGRPHRPPSRWRTVRILLECILVIKNFLFRVLFLVCVYLPMGTWRQFYFCFWCMAIYSYDMLPTTT